MSRARHKKEHHRAHGGKVVAYAGGSSNVMKEAHERKRGGRVHDGEGHEGKHHAGKRKRHGKHHEHHRARGGAVGSDKRPLSSAAKVKFLPEERGGGKGAGPANEQTDH